MIERLTGSVVAVSTAGVVVDVGGVGFLTEVSSMTLHDIPAVGEPCVLFTHLHVRDDAILLYGFSTEEERELFRLLISVSKIGPKLALATLSFRRPRELKRALATGDVALLTTVPGIGKKTAERIILELREKVTALDIDVGGEGAGVPYGDDDRLVMARAALLELGLSAQEAERLLVDADPEATLEQIVRHALGGRS